MSKVYVVSAELWSDDSDYASYWGSSIFGVFDSEEKAAEDIKNHYGDDYRDYMDCGPWKSYKYDTDEGLAVISIDEREVNKSLLKDLA